jgi:hypothetical protein
MTDPNVWNKDRLQYLVYEISVKKNTVDTTDIAIPMSVKIIYTKEIIR